MDSNDDVLDRFLTGLQQKNLELYPAQETAILELYEEHNVILNTPTGSGKSLVAAALHFKALAQGKRSVYTCPVKALVNEKWMALCREFGAENVGLSTGDATVNRDAPILCCTAEILANIALREGPSAPFHDVIMDEFHFYSDRERGVAWQVPLLVLPQCRFLLMSATLGDTTFFEEELMRLNGRPTVTVQSATRPVPLQFSYAETPLPTTLEALLDSGKSPVYVVHFTQREAAESAQAFTSINPCTRDEKAAIARELEGFKFNSPYGAEIKKWLRHGIGLHHAGLLPKYRVLVEQLAQRGLLKVICGTDTLGVGINVPIRTVLFTKLCKFDGQKTGILSAREFHQIAGRAGRKGFDDIGWVVAQAPAHVIENLQLEEKQAKGGKKFVRRKPPEKGFVNWDKQTFTRLSGAPPERLASQFQVSHGMLLNVLSRAGDGCGAMRALIRNCHDTPKAKRAHTKRAWQLFRALLERKIIEFAQPDSAPATESCAAAAPHGARSHIRLNVDLQEDFSLNQTLALYVHDTLPLLDPAAPDYALVVLTLVESILEDPDVILRKQLDRVKSRALAEMKQDGMEYEARMEELDKLEYPKPNRDFIYSTFNAFADRHPWVGQENIRPKSIVREMFEEYRSFADYIKSYELQRSEGVLLRHIATVHKTLAQSVPDTAKNDQLREMELYLRAMVRQVDSSLLEQWEKLRNPGFEAQDAPELRPPGAAEAEADLTRDPKRLTAAARATIFAFLRSVIEGEYAEALALLEPGQDPSGAPWTAESLQAAVERYYAVHDRIRLDPEARNIRHTYVSVPGTGTWSIQQMLIDPEDANDWCAEFELDLARTRETSEPVMRLVSVKALGT